MPFDSLSLAAISRDLSESLTGDRVQAIHQPDPLTLLITFSHKRRILISASPDSARAHLCSHNLSHPAQPPAFCMLLRKYLESARLQSVCQPRFDRILELGFVRSGEVMTLVAELMGRYSNIMLRDDEGLLRGVIKPVPAAHNRFRELAAGRAYMPPPSGGKTNPLDGPIMDRTADVIQRSAEVGIGRAMAESWTGMSPLIVSWLLERAGTAADDSQPPPAALVKALQELRDIVTSGRFEPSLFRGKGGRDDFWALRPPGDPAGADAPSLSMSRVVEEFFERQIGTQELENLRRGALNAIQHAIQRERRKLDDFERVAEVASHADEYRRWAEALMAYPGLAPSDSGAAVLPDPSGDGGELVVPLDPDLSAIENAEHYFKKARQSQRSARQVVERAVASRDALRSLDRQRERVEAANQIDTVRQVIEAGNDWSAGRARPAAPDETGKKKKSTEPSLPPGVRRVEGFGGYEILYGRSSADNDYLTTRVARPNDIWLHVRGETSAHVVIRTNNQPDRVPRETLLQAANVAAIHSASKHSSYVAVDYTLRKYVVKRRGSPPGTVEYRSEKTLQVQPRLE